MSRITIKEHIETVTNLAKAHETQIKNIFKELEDEIVKRESKDKDLKVIPTSMLKLTVRGIQLKHLQKLKRAMQVLKDEYDQFF